MKKPDAVPSRLRNSPSCMMPAKTDLRQRLNTRVAGMTPEARRRASAEMCRRLVDDPGLRNAAVLGVYLALPDELDLRPALETFLRRNQTLALPFPETRGLWVFREIRSLDGPAGPWGLPCPEPGPRLDPGLLDAVLVPGRGFTPGGRRLGRGKGIYDRLLNGIRAKTIGIAFPCQLVKSLPQEPHDVRLDEIRTPAPP